jgi:hypothetical protein
MSRGLTVAMASTVAQRRMQNREIGSGGRQSAGQSQRRWTRLFASFSAAAIAALACTAVGAWGADRSDRVGASLVTPTAEIKASLRSAYAAGAGIPVAAVGAIRPGSLHVASVASSHTEWAVARFLPGRRAAGPRAWGFQSGRGLGLFTTAHGGSWRLVTLGGRSLPCIHGLPASVRKVWHLAPASTCTAHRSTTAAARAAARGHRHGSSIAERSAAIALRQVGVKGTPVAHDFSLDCDPYTPLLGPTTPNSDGCGYDRSFRVQGRNETWCSDFVKWVWEQAGVTEDLNTINAGAVSFYGWGRDAGQRLSTNPTNPRVGDAVVFFPRGSISANESADHVGIITSVNPDGTINMVNGDFLNPRAHKVSVEYDTHLDLASWASTLWGRGEQWVFVSPPRAAAHPAPRVTSLTGSSRAVTSTAVGFHAHAVQPGGSIVSYVWSFGDGGSAIGAHVRHVFRSPGPQTVTVTATSNLNTVRSWHRSIRVVSGSSAVANTPDGAEYYTTQPVRQQLFGVSARGALTEQKSTTGGPWTVRTLPGTPSAHSAVTALNYANSSYRMTQHVYFRDARGALAETDGSGRSWETTRIGGRPAAASPIVAALTSRGLKLIPRVFAVNTDGQLIEAVRHRSRWSIRTLPGKPSPTTSLAVTDVVRHGAVEAHLLYLDRCGQLRDDVRRIDHRWRRRAVTGSRQPAPGSSLAAVGFGPQGRVLRVFYLDRTGALVEARSRARGWSSRVLPGAPARSSRLLAQTYLPTSVTASSSRLILSVFYLTADGDPAQTSHAPTTPETPHWVATTLGGTGDALLGASAYPDGVQGQQLFYRFGTAVYDNAYTPVDGGWYPSRMPGSAAR